MKYYLKENKLTEEENYLARVQVEQAHDLEGIIDLILDRRNLVSRTDMVAVFNAFFETVQGCIKRGEAVNLPLFNLNYSISGVFEDEDDTYDPSRHRIKVNLNDGLLITHALKDLKLSKIESPDTEPTLKYFKDTASNTSNDTLTPNSIFELTGNRLRIAGDQANIGLYLVAEDGSETAVTLIAVNTPKKLVAQAPSLPAGSYRLRLRTQYCSGNQLTKEAKETTSGFVLTVS